MSTIFKPRTSAPATTDKNWIHTSKGGYNGCILISGNAVIPNCVGYAWGRMRELLGYNPKLSKGNAETWYAYKDGYARGKTPKLGAVICYAKGSATNSADGAGHVAIVEDIYSDGSILVSQSAYGGTRFSTKKLSKGYAWSGLTFQGFIYPPVEFVKEAVTTSTESTYVLVKDVKGYTNATNAKNRTNSTVVYKAGTYYVYKESGGMINITKTKGTAGAWINPSDNKVTAVYYAKYTGKSQKIDEVFAEIGVPASYTGKWDRRLPVAKANGITNYTGTYSQNTELINYAKQGKLKKV